MDRAFGLRATVYERWMCRYNNIHRYTCKIKDCTNKLRNGRCGLDMCRLDSGEVRRLTGICLDYIPNS